MELKDFLRAVPKDGWVIVGSCIRRKIIDSPYYSGLSCPISSIYNRPSSHWRICSEGIKMKEELAIALTNAADYEDCGFGYIKSEYVTHWNKLRKLLIKYLKPEIL